MSFNAEIAAKAAEKRLVLLEKAIGQLSSKNDPEAAIVKKELSMRIEAIAKRLEGIEKVVRTLVETRGDSKLDALQKTVAVMEKTLGTADRQKYDNEMAAMRKQFQGLLQGSKDLYEKTHRANGEVEKRLDEVSSKFKEVIEARKKDEDKYTSLSTEISSRVKKQLDDAAIAQAKKIEQDFNAAVAAGLKNEEKARAKSIEANQKQMEATMKQLTDQRVALLENQLAAMMKRIIELEKN